MQPKDNYPDGVRPDISQEEACQHHTEGGRQLTLHVQLHISPY